MAGQLGHGDHAGRRVPGAATLWAAILGPDVGVIGIFEASHQLELVLVNDDA